MDTPPSSAAPVGFDGLYGLEIAELAAGRARATVTVSNRIKQPAGLVHGGVYSAIAESLAARGTAFAVGERGEVPRAIANRTSFLRAIRGGTITAVARAVHRGRTTWVWEVEISDGAGALCAVSRITLAIERRSPPGA
jgi:uncharacterized protein (TIGR00369 family)